MFVDQHKAVHFAKRASTVEARMVACRVSDNRKRAMAGGADAGKSTLVAVLSQGGAEQLALRPEGQTLNSNPAVAGGMDAGRARWWRC